MERGPGPGTWDPDKSGVGADTDTIWMRRALRLARRAGAAGEVPIGAVVVREDKLLGAAANAPIASNDPSAHAEILALRRAARRAGNYRLPGAMLYVTIEPCAMCAGAIVQARLARVVYGAPDPRAGAAGSVFDLLTDARLNHRAEVTAGIEAEAAAELLQRFFRARRC
ncbi:MAG: tRNA adenosine(34) deaminase TadA [Gammaproteobacteria bacterium]